MISLSLHSANTGTLLRNIGFLIALSMLAGCSVGPKYRLPDVRVPPFHNAPRAGTEKSAAPPLDTWWEGFPPAYGLSTSAIASIPVAGA